MTETQAVILGILQGAGEFLPVSSSGHLSLLQYFWGLTDTPRFFDVMLHVGTLAAVLGFYGRSLWPKRRTIDGPQLRFTLRLALLNFFL